MSSSFPLRDGRSAVRLILVSAVLAACSAPTAPGPSSDATPADVSSTTRTAADVPTVTSAPAAGTSATVFDVATLPALVQTQLKTYSFFDHVRAVLVQVDGEVVVEEYWQTDATASRNAFSVTKSFLSTLIGIAIGEGALPGVDTDLATLLPERAAEMTPEIAAITLRELLTMTSGLPDTFATGMTFADAPDWVARILADGVDRAPGEFAYGDANSHLAAAALARATGGSVFDYAATRLFEPLGIPTAGAPVVHYTDEGLAAYEAAGLAWPVDPQGVHAGASDLKLTPRQMLALGELYLNEGRIDDRQVVPASWVAEATSAGTPAGDVNRDAEYGYHWWITTAGDVPAYAAVGYGGQLVEVIPSLRTVVVVSSDLQVDGDPVPMVDPRELMTSLVSRVIAPALAAR